MTLIKLAALAIQSSFENVENNSIVVLRWIADPPAPQLARKHLNTGTFLNIINKIEWVISEKQQIHLKRHSRGRGNPGDCRSLFLVS